MPIIAYSSGALARTLMVARPAWPGLAALGDALAALDPLAVLGWLGSAGLRDSSRRR